MKECNCEELLTAALHAIRRRLDAYYWNRNQERFAETLNDPFDNTAAEWHNGTFRVKAYNWDNNDEPNFRWKNVSIWWYKYLGRGMECQVDGGEMTPDLINDMLNDCLESMPL